VQGESKSFAMKRRVRFKDLSKERGVVDRNVVGFLEGSDPDLESEVVIFSAHYDHIGIGTPAEEDSIYNGAADNASGVAGLLELAEAFTLLQKRPRRSLLFLAVTAEEKGLLGSEFYVKNPIIHLENTVANFNLDMLGIGDDPEIIVYGSERSSLGQIIRKAAEVVELKIIADELPEERFYQRSDHYNFARMGVPAIYPSIAIDKKSSSAFSTYYHRPNDDIHLPFNYQYMKKHVQMILLAGLWMANADERPQWTEGDEFENVRKRMRD
jgi:Zn-dependent M28 family amino/carboxypeptidase